MVQRKGFYHGLPDTVTVGSYLIINKKEEQRELDI